MAVRLLLLFNPAGAILQAIEAIYRVLKWVFQNAARIFTLIETIVNGIADIIAGNVGGFANAVEKGLAMLIAPVLGFIADYLSFGDLPQAVAKQIKSFQRMDPRPHREGVRLDHREGQGAAGGGGDREEGEGEECGRRERALDGR